MTEKSDVYEIEPPILICIKIYFFFSIRNYFLMTARRSHQRCYIKKVFLEISQNSQENTCDSVSF